MRLRRGLAIAALLLALAGGAVFAARGIGPWLRAAEPPAAADAIVVLAGDPRRAPHAADLYAQGLAPLILVSRPARDGRETLLDDMRIPFPRGEEINREILQRRGVPADRIRYFGRGLVSTYDEALALRRELPALLPTDSSHRLLVVTSPYHVRRARLVLAGVLGDSGLQVVPTPYEDFPGSWWASQDAARDVLLETAKLAFYLAGGRFAAGRP